MNHVYRIVFNRALGLVQVASELASGRGAGGASTRGPRPGRRSLLAVALVLASAGALAQVAPGQLPTGADVVGGISNITQGPDPDNPTLTITQDQARALIRWDSFDIGSDAQVIFEQTANQVALNQIVAAADPSQILGHLEAGGTIFLINPSGIIFGADATVDVGGLVASTLAPDDAEAFLETSGGAYVHDQFQWNAGATGAMVVNGGAITASGGQVALLGAGVENAGTITVDGGQAMLMAAGSARIELMPGGLQAVVPMAVVGDVPVGGGVENTGSISAAGGTIVLRGEYADGLVSTAVNNSGSLHAAGIGGDPDGSITVLASDAVAAGGTIDAGLGSIDMLAGGDISLDSTLVAGDLQLSSDAAVQQGAGSLTVSGATTVVAQGDIALDGIGNDFGGVVALDGGAASISNSGRLVLGAVDVASLEADASAIELGGNVTSSGGQVYNAEVFLGADATLDAGGGVSFASTIEGPQALSITSGGHVGIADDVEVDGLSIDAASFTAGGSMRVWGDLAVEVATGGIGQSDAFLVSGQSSFDAGSGAITLNNAGNDFTGAVSLAGGTIAINDSNALQLGTLDAGSLIVTSHGELDLGSGFIVGSLQASSDDHAIEQAGALIVGGTADIDAHNANIDLADANDFGGAVSLAGGMVSINDTGALTLGTLGVTRLTVSSHGALNLGAGWILDTLDADSGGGANTQQGILSVSGDVSLDSGGGSINLTNTGNTFLGTVALEGGVTSLRASSTPLRLGAVEVGSIDVGASEIVLAGDVVTTGDQTYAGEVDLGADVGLQAGGGVSFSSSVTGADYQLAVEAGGHVALGGATQLGGLTVDAESFAAGSSVTTHGDLSLAVFTGGIGQAGAFVVGGNADFDAGSGGIVLGHAGNDFQGLVSLAGGGVTINDVNALQLGTLDTGSLTVTSHGTLDLGSGSIGGALAASSDGHAIAQAGSLAVAGTSLLDAGSATIDLDDPGNDFGGAVSLTGGAASIHDQGALRLGTLALSGPLTASSGGALDLGRGTVAGHLDADSGGAITQSGALQADSTSLAAVGDITLVAANSFGLLSLSGGAVLVRGGTQLELDSVDVESLIAQAPVIHLQQDVLTTGGQTYAGAVRTRLNDITLEGNDVYLASSLDSTMDLTIRAGTRVEIAGAVDADASLTVDAGSFGAGAGMDIAGDLSLTVATGGLAQSGAFLVEGTARFDAGTGDIALSHAGNNFVGQVSLTGGAVSINDVDALALGALDVGSLSVTSHGPLDLGAGSIAGDLVADSDGGPIGQSGALAVGGGSALDAGTADITLIDAGNDFVGAVSLTGAAVTVNDVNALTLGTLDVTSLDASSHDALDLGTGTVTGNLVANSGGGAITQSGALSIGGSSAISAGAGDITLDDGGNDFVGAVSLTGGAVEIADAGALRLAALDVASLDASSRGLLELGAGSIAGDLVADSDGGPIGQSGPLAVGGSSTLDAGAADISLLDMNNDFVGAVSLTGGSVVVADRNQLTLGQVDATHLLALAATIALEQDIATTGDQAYAGAVLLDGDLALAAGGDVDFASTVTGPHALSVTADGHVGFADAVAVGALAVDAGSLGLASSLDVSGDLSLAVQSGGIAQSQAFSVGGQTSLDAGTGAIALNHANNDFVGAVSLTGGAVAINDVNALTLGTLDLGSLGASSHGTLDLGQGTIAGNLVADSGGGAIGQSGALAVGGSSAINAGAGDITRDDGGNDFVGAVSLTGGAVSISDANALALGTLDAGSLVARSHGALNLGTGSVAGALDADSDGGAIGQSGALAVGGASTVDAGAGDIALTHADNDFIGAVSLTGGAVAIADRNQLTLGQVDATSLSATAATIELEQDIATSGDQTYGGAVLLDDDLALTAGGDVEFSSTVTGPHALSVNAGGHAGFGDAVAVGGLAVDAGSLDLASSVVVSGDLSLAVQTGGITQSQSFVVGGQTSLDAGTGAIALTHVGNDFVGAVSLTGGAVAINDVNALTLGTLDVGSLQASSHGTLDLGQGTIAGGLVADSDGGDIGQSGALAVGASSALDAGGGDITLDDSGNDFAGAVTLTGGAVAIGDANALTLGTLDVGSLTARSHGALDLGAGSVAGALEAYSDGGDIGQSGALRVGGASAVDAGAGDIALTHAGNDFGGAVSLAGGAVAINDANAFNLGTLDVASLSATSHGALDLGGGTIAGALVADSNGGDIGQSGALVVGGTSALDAGAGAIVLTDAGNDFGGLVSLFGGAVAISDIDSLALDAFDLQSLSVTSHGDLLLGGGSIAGALVADSNGGDIGQSGALRVGGTSAIDAGTGAVALTHADNDFGGAVGLAGASLSIRDRNDLALSHLRPAGDTDVHVTAGGALTLPTEAIDAGGGNLHLAANGGALTTRARLAGAQVTLLGAGGIALGHDVDAAGTLRLDSGAGISQSGGRIQAAQLAGSAAGNARLTGANRIETLGQFSASGIALTNAGPLTVAGPVDARSGSLLLALTQGDLAIDGTVSAADIRLEVAGGIAQGDDGRLEAGSLSGRAGGPVVLGDAERFIDNRIERIGDFTAREGFSLTNGRSLTLASINGSDFTIDAGSADVYLAVGGDLRQAGTEWMYNGRGTWSATGGIGLPASPIYVMGLEAQTVAALGVPPAYFYAVRPDGSLLPIVGEAVNVPTSVWAGRAQTSSSRQVSYVDVGADASNYRGYGLVEPGVRLPEDQRPECDPDFPDPECEALQ